MLNTTLGRKLFCWFSHHYIRVSFLESSDSPRY